MIIGNAIYAVSYSMAEQSQQPFCTEYDTVQPDPPPNKRQPKQPPRPEDEPNKKQPNDVPPFPKPPLPPG